MGNVMLTQVNIGGTDVTSKLIKYRYERTFGQEISIIELTFSKNITSLVTLANGQALTVSRGWTTATDESIFIGFVEVYEPEGATIKIIGKDKLSQLVNREVTYSYDEDIDPSAGKISEIFEDLVMTYGGLTMDGTSLQDSGTTFKLKKFIGNHSGVFERCKKLSEILDWQFYYKASTNLVYFEPSGYTNNATILSTGTNIINVPKWSFDNTEMMNKITVIGAETTVQKTEKFNGNGSTTNFTLTTRPADITVYVTATDPPPESAKKALQVEGSPISADAYIDYEKKRVRFAVAPTTGTNNVQVIYSYMIPTPVVSEDSGSITSYGLYQKTIFEPDIRHLSDAERRVNKLLEKYSQPFVSSTFQVRNISTSAIDVGQKIYVSDTVNNVSRWVIINKYIIEYPNKYDTLEVGDKQWRLSDWGTKVMEKIQRLEEESSKNQDYLLHIVGHTVTATSTRVSINIWRQFIQNSFILGHSNNGLLGSPQGNPQPILGDYRTGSTSIFSATY